MNGFTENGFSHTTLTKQHAGTANDDNKNENLTKTEVFQ